MKINPMWPLSSDLATGVLLQWRVCKEVPCDVVAKIPIKAHTATWEALVYIKS